MNKSLTFEEITDQFDDNTVVNSNFPANFLRYEIKNQCQQIFGPESDACEQHLVS